MIAPEASAVAKLAEEGDPERFLFAQLAPAEDREGLFALIAFNCELAKIPVSVSEPMLGEIRLAWWREALDDLFEKGVTRRHEVMEALAASLARAEWDRDLLAGMIDARLYSLEGLPANPAEAGTFIEDTAGAYHRLAVGALGGRSADAQEVAGAVGWAEGAGRLVAALSQEAEARGEQDELAATLTALRDQARAKLADARSRRSAAPRAARAPLGSVYFAEAAINDVSPPDQASLRERLRLGWRMATKRF